MSLNKPSLSGFHLDQPQKNPSERLQITYTLMLAGWDVFGSGNVQEKKSLSRGKEEETNQYLFFTFVQWQCSKDTSFNTKQGANYASVRKASKSPKMKRNYIILTHHHRVIRFLY